MSSPEGGIGYYDEKLGTVFVEKDARGSIPLERLAHVIYHAFHESLRTVPSLPNLRCRFGLHCDASHWSMRRAVKALSLYI